MKGCEISLNPYKHWENWHFKCAKIGVLVAVDTDDIGQLSLSLGMSRPLRDDELFASENLRCKNEKGDCYEKRI